MVHTGCTMSCLSHKVKARHMSLSTCHGQERVHMAEGEQVLGRGNGIQYIGGKVMY